MGLISWIKGQYYDHKFQKAKDLIEDGDTTEAIKILEDILDCHMDAPQALLEVYHSLILKGNKASFASAANLCGRYPELKADCIKFVRNSNVLNRALYRAWYIDYCQALFGNGVTVLKSDFVNASIRYIKDNKSINNLRSLSINNTLLVALAKALLTEAEISYKQKSLQESIRLCGLIKPYLINYSDFCELYANVRFDSVVSTQMSEDTGKRLIGVLDYAEKHLQAKAKTDIVQKGIEFAGNLYTGKDYVSSLIISQHFVDKYSDAKKIYADSALELYRLSSKEQSLVVPDILYACLGEGLAFISALEPFLSSSVHRGKYVSTVEEELAKLAQTNLAVAQNLLLHAWHLVPDAQLIKTVFRVGTEDSKRAFVDFIISSKDILSSQATLNVFVNEVIKFSSFDTYVVETLERLLDEGKDVSAPYEEKILEYSHKATNKKKAIECIQRALKRVKSSNLYAAIIGYLKDYVKSNKYDSAFALAVAESLVGCHGLAEVLIAHIMLDDAVRTKDDVIKERKLRKALAFNKKYSNVFDTGAYGQLMPRIERLFSNLARKIYPTDKSHATELLYLLRDNNLSWYDTYATLCLESIPNEQESEELAARILAVISEDRRSASSLKNELWVKFVSVKTHICCKDDNVAICELTNLINIVESQCTTTNKQECKKLVVKKLCERLFSCGKKSETAKLYGEAIADYEQILKYDEDFKNAKERLFICKLKSGKKILRKDEKQISDLLSQKNGRPTQYDLAFRWCIYLLSNGNIEKAESINATILGNDSEILQICQKEKILSKQKTLDMLNEKIRRLNESTLSPEDALKLGRDLSKTLDDIKLIVKVSPQKVNALKESIRLYAIEEFYKKGDALKSLGEQKVQDSTYLSDPIAMRNMAIMSLVAAENGQLTQGNYKELLALWATAIYQQRIFVKSLAFTSWDDPYTFSLESALGKLDGNAAELPDNVNYDIPDGTHVVSILEVQKTLISRMEKAIEGNAEYLSFFSSQLEAMSMLASQHLCKMCVVVAPYLASISNAYMNEIEQALNYEASQHYGNWEEILKVGNLYGLTNGDFYRYSSALEIKNTILLAIKDKKSLNLVSRKIPMVKKFACLYSEVVSAVTTCMNCDISQEVRYRTFDTYYRGLVRAIDDDTLTFLFSNYINQQAVKSLNEKKETLAQASPVLFEIYEFCKCNPHLKRNVKNIVEALIHNYITNGDEDNLPILDKVLSSTREFDSIVVKALTGGVGVPEDMMILLFSSNENRFETLKSQIGRKSVAIHSQFDATAAKVREMKLQLELSQIVQGVNGHSVCKCDALEQIYNLYRFNKDNVRICQNLAAVIPMCVVEYIIPDKVGKIKVKKVLNALKLNMSSTFRANNSGIGQAYKTLWNQLPYNARDAIQNSPYTLNEQGMALKEGLDYLNALK